MKTIFPLLAGAICDPLMISDGHCDANNNNPDCEYDGGDCCLEEEETYCFFCNADECVCHETGLTHCSVVTGKHPKH